ncbi:hypothetical protein F1C12_21150 [Leifsonia shinshuensis]|uniref:DUF559 domain-containing protein n=1 Tax=Leifsonia shinshuensis TaxID=150026 RepID=A0A7G6YFV3_9MICO|nr:hypothetical protein F1C12_21150 [Leifsonia shinshuensis]
MGRRAAELGRDFSSGAFRTRDAVERGVSAGRLRASDLHTPIRGVRVAGGDTGLETRCRAFLLHRQERVAFSHTTAAELLGAPLPAAARGDDRLHVSVPAGGRAVQAASVAGHTLSAWRTISFRGLPLTTPEQTWLDLAAILGRDALVAVGDWLLSYRHPLTTAEALTEIVRTASGRRGIATARAALPLVRTRSESPAETRLRLILLDAGLAEPWLNYLIHRPDGSFLARVDMAYPLERVILEYEGDGHRVDREVWFRDIHRREHLEDLGWRVVRVTAADLRTPIPLLTRLSRLLATRRE